LLTVQTIFSSVRPEMTEEYFSCHSSLSFIFQYVGVIFNHNKISLMNAGDSINIVVELENKTDHYSPGLHV